MSSEILRFIRDVVDPELVQLRAERDRLALRLAQREGFVRRAQRLEHEGFVILSQTARWMLEAEETGRTVGLRAAAAYANLHTNGRHL